MATIKDRADEAAYLIAKILKEKKSIEIGDTTGLSKLIEGVFSITEDQVYQEIINTLSPLQKAVLFGEQSNGSPDPSQIGGDAGRT